MTRTVCGRCEMDKCQCKTIGATEMTREDIIRLAREAGGADITAKGFTSWVGTQSTEFLERFAALVAAAEREACAKVCEDDVRAWSIPGSITKAECAAAIRKRGEVKP